MTEWLKEALDVLARAFNLHKLRTRDGPSAEALFQVSEVQDPGVSDPGLKYLLRQHVEDPGKIGLN